MTDTLFTPQREPVSGFIIDSFAGGGGAAAGIKKALGRCPDLAINHNEVALSMHAANHPKTKHIVENVWHVDVDGHSSGRLVFILWASPDCRHFSIARGGQPTSKSVRGLAWSIVKMAKDLKRRRPEIIFLENVVEFLGWEDFPAWSKALKKLGYKMEYRELRACDYGVPTIRKRLFIVMRRDGRKIAWPKPTHGKVGSPAVLKGELKPWVSAASVIDFSIPCPSIFDTKEDIKEKYGLRSIRPLADATQKRIAAGVFRYVINAKDPFFVTIGQHGGSNRSAFDPLNTITASQGDQNAVVVPTLIQMGYGDKRGQPPRVLDLNKPVGTITAQGNKFALVSAFLAQHNSQRVGVNPGRPMSEPISTITGRGTQQQVVAAHLIHLKGSNRNDSPLTDPLNTICAGGTHAGLVAAFLTKYNGLQHAQKLDKPAHSIKTKNGDPVVVVHINGTPYMIVDIGMRMLTPRELFNAQGFPADYIIDRGADGRPITKTDQIHKCGNSVPPTLVEALVGENT